jgi:hypothetical protein
MPQAQADLLHTSHIGLCLLLFLPLKPKMTFSGSIPECPHVTRGLSPTRHLLQGYANLSIPVASKTLRDVVAAEMLSSPRKRRHAACQTHAWRSSKQQLACAVAVAVLIGTAFKLLSEVKPTQRGVSLAGCACAFEM